MIARRSNLLNILYVVGLKLQTAINFEREPDPFWVHKQASTLLMPTTPGPASGLWHVALTYKIVNNGLGHQSVPKLFSHDWLIDKISNIQCFSNAWPRVQNRWTAWGLPRPSGEREVSALKNLGEDLTLIWSHSAIVVMRLPIGAGVIGGICVCRCCCGPLSTSVMVMSSLPQLWRNSTVFFPPNDKQRVSTSIESAGCWYFTSEWSPLACKSTQLQQRAVEHGPKEDSGQILLVRTFSCCMLKSVLRFHGVSRSRARSRVNPGLACCLLPWRTSTLRRCVPSHLTYVDVAAFGRSGTWGSNFTSKTPA